MFVYSFEKLDVWKLSRSFVAKIYLITKKFPPEEKYNTVSQLRRAAVSITTNIAEGSCRRTKKDQINFYNFAYSSLLEVLNLLLVSSDLKFITEDELLSLRKVIEEISNKINALVKSLGGIN